MLNRTVFANRLKAARIAAGLSQGKVTGISGVSRSALVNAETGKRLPETYTVVTLAKLYNVSLDWLFGMDAGETVIFFDNERQLQTLTGLDHKGLWDAGFNLDDWDYGFVTVEEWPDPDGMWSADVPEYQWHLPMLISGNCCAFTHTEWQGRHYYMRYHA